MNRVSTIARRCLYVAIMLIAMPSVHAATVEATARKGYGRMNFHFSAPAKLKPSIDGTQVVLVFDAPVSESAEAIGGSLPQYVQSASVSADKRTVTLTLTQPMRLRQFVSGSNVGIDLIEGGAPTTQAKSKVTPPAPASTASKKEVPLPKTPAAKAAKKPVPEQPLLTTKKSLPEKLSDAVTTQLEDPMLSTKPAATAETSAESTIAKQDETLLTTKKPEPAAEQPLAEAAQKPVEAPTKETPASPVAPPPSASPAETPAPPTQAAESVKPSGPFVVTARSNNGETIINFPWSQRTASAVFQRARDIWVVFSRAQDVNAGLLRTVLPKNIISTTQYAYKGNTVLRFVTDGTVHATAKQAANGYGWDIVISAAAERPTLDVAIAVDSLEGTQRVVLGIFDVAPTLQFYDPNAGEQLLVVPSFETGRAVNTERSFPEFSILASNQGVAVVARRPDLSLTQTRAGLILSSHHGLAVSESLPLLKGTAPVAGASISSGVMMPYDQWFVPPARYLETLMHRLAVVAAATKATRADSMMELVKLYLSNGFGTEALGVLSLIQQEFPNYYTSNGLALLSAASNVLNGHMDAAASDLMAPELNEREEAQLWRQVVALYAPPVSAVDQLQQATSDAANNDPVIAAAAAAEAAKATPVVVTPMFQYLKFNKPFIRFYPPRIRQRLAKIAADAYLADDQEEKALAVYDLLIRDAIAEPLALDAEFALAKTAEKKGEITQALEMFDRLASQSKNRYITTRARYNGAMLRYHKGQLTANDAAEILERTRVSWRGDVLEMRILQSLIGLYKDSKSYADILRAQKALLEAFPNHPETLTIAGDMSELFELLFLNPDPEMTPMEPLQSLSLFYEFRELTPLGDKGDRIIQQLADRLAAIDLLDGATQLLENQIKFRSTGESRSKIGARLALLHLLNKHPQEALNVLEVTNFGGNAPELQVLRRQLTAESLTKLGKYEEALSMLYSDTSTTGAQLRLNTLWAMKDWTNIINRAEDMLSARASLTDPLNAGETETLLRLALAYCFESDYTQLRYLRDYYSDLIPDTAYKQIFDFITNDTAPLDPEDFAMLAQQISRTENFLDTFKAKIAAGKLSEAIQ